jgi:hypothetical protein
MQDGVLFNGALEMAQGIRELPRETSLHSVAINVAPGLKRVNG